MKADEYRTGICRQASAIQAHHLQGMLHVCRQQGRCERPFQESVFNIWKSYKNFRGESSFVTWVYRISLNTCISDFRKKKKYDYVPLEQQVDILEDCEHNELLKEMYSLIKRLNKVDRMFILLWLDEKSYDEIAEITGTNRNNVAIKLHRIKEKLKICRTCNHTIIWNLKNCKKHGKS